MKFFLKYRVEHYRPRRTQSQLRENTKDPARLELAMLGSLLAVAKRRKKDEK